MRCRHPDHDCTDLACPCLCSACVDDRMAIYRAIEGERHRLNWRLLWPWGTS
jgi:hypothetical protein